MKRAATFSSASLIAAFAVGSGILSVGKSPLLPSIFAALAALALLPLVEWAARSVYCGDVGFWRRVLFAMTVAVAVATAASAAEEFTSFVAHSMLSGAPTLAVKIIFIFLAAYLALLGRDSVKKFALVSFIIVSTVAAVLFLLSVRSFNGTRILTVFSREISFSEVASELGGVFASSVLAVIYLSLGESGKRSRGAFLAVVFSSVILILCRLNVSLLLSDSLVLKVEYPYSEAVSTVSAGKLFARLEGWAYLMYYTAAATRVSVCLSLACRLFFMIFPFAERKRLVLTLLPFVLGALSLVDVTNLLSFS